MSSRTLALARRSALALGLATAVLTLPAVMPLAHAYDETSRSAVNVDKNGVGLHGYDPVAYFVSGKPTKGSTQYTATHDGAIFRFASQANRDRFRADPAKYAPAYGGFCAMGAALDKKFDGDPKLWRIVDGKLYVNVAAPAQKRWLEDVPGNITKANQNWTKIRDKAPKEL
jgi:YHS domain-containing protein